MMNSDILKYIFELNEIHPEIFPELRQFACEKKIPIIQKEVANFLQVILTIVQPASILEIGTAFGYSTLIMASCVKNCLIHCLELSKPACVQFKNTVNTYQSILKNNNINIELFEGKAQKILKALNRTYHFIFIDARKDEYMEYLIDLEKVLDNKSIIIADNCLWKGLVASAAQDEKLRVKIIRDFNQYLFNSQNYLTSLLPIGDGLIFCVRI